MEAEDRTSAGEQLEQFIRREHLAIPPTLWGYFFPVTVACWRFLHDLTPEAVPEVHAQKWDFVSPIPGRLTVEGSNYRMERFPAGLPELPEDPAGPLFFGDHTEQFLNLICADGPLLDQLEAISWKYLKSISREQMHSGHVVQIDLPFIDPAEYQLLAALLVDGIRNLQSETAQATE